MVTFGCQEGALHSVESPGLSTEEGLSNHSVLRVGRRWQGFVGLSQEYRWRFTYHMSKYLQVINQANKM